MWCQGEAIPSKRFERFFVRGRGERRGELVLVSELGFRIFFEREKKRVKREKERGFVKVALLTADHAKMYLKLRHRSTYYNYGLLLLLLL